MRKLIFTFLVLSGLIVSSCDNERNTFYKLPTNLEEAIYKQLAVDGRFTQFLRAIDRVPSLKDELSSSGLYTVFAPTDDAFMAYFQENGKYSSMEQIPDDELVGLVKFHILKWMIFKSQFEKPGSSGDAYTIFTYETRTADNNYEEYSDVLKARYKIYYENKRIQVYSSSFWSYFGVTQSDYNALYGDGSSVSAKMNVMGASVIETDISSGNGVIHVIDKVLERPNNIAQELDKNSEYSELNTILKEKLVSYQFDLTGTKLQGNMGDPNSDGIIDSLYRRNYRLVPGLDYEKGYFMTAYIPSKVSFNAYVTEKILPGFSNSTIQVPSYVWDLFFKNLFSSNPYWPSKLLNSLAVSLSGDIIHVTSDEIESMKMLSNGIFYRLNKVIEPNAFTAVSGSVLLSSDYSDFATLLISSGLLNSLSNPKSSYLFFAPKNSVVRTKIQINYATSLIQIPKEDGNGMRNMTANEIKDYVGNHIIVSAINSSPPFLSKGFYNTLNGSVLRVDENGIVTGGDPEVSLNLNNLNKIMSNGRVVEADELMSPPLLASNYYRTGSNTGALNGERFYFTMLYERLYPNGLDFIDNRRDDKYTFLMPSEPELKKAIGAGKIPMYFNMGFPVLTLEQTEQLKEFLKMHIIKGVFYTDGKLTGTFETFATDKALSNPAKKIYLKVMVESVSGNLLKFSDPFGHSTIIDINSKYDQIVKEGVIHAVDSPLFTTN